MIDGFSMVGHGSPYRWAHPPLTPPLTEPEESAEPLRGIAFEQDGAYVVVCLDHYLMTVAKTAAQIPDAVRCMLLGHAESCMESGKEPFDGLPKAPERYWNMGDS